MAAISWSSVVSRAASRTPSLSTGATLLGGMAAKSWAIVSEGLIAPASSASPSVFPVQTKDPLQFTYADSVSGACGTSLAIGRAPRRVVLIAIDPAGIDPAGIEPAGSAHGIEPAGIEPAGVEPSCPATYTPKTVFAPGRTLLELPPFASSASFQLA